MAINIQRGVTLSCILTGALFTQSCRDKSTILELPEPQSALVHKSASVSISNPSTSDKSTNLSEVRITLEPKHTSDLKLYSTGLDQVYIFADPSLLQPGTTHETREISGGNFSHESKNELVVVHAMQGITSAAGYSPNNFKGSFTVALPLAPSFLTGTNIVAKATSYHIFGYLYPRLIKDYALGMDVSTNLPSMLYIQLLPATKKVAR